MSSGLFGPPADRRRLILRSAPNPIPPQTPNPRQTHTGASTLPMRHISLDRILQGSSDIPSGQPRTPPRPRVPRPQPPLTRRVSGSRGLPHAVSRTGQHIPSRTTKLSEKLVLLPEADEDDIPEDGDYAERLPKVQRTEKVSRLTAYCTAQSFNMKQTTEFLKQHHEARTKLYDDCLYVIYALPLLPGSDGYRVRSRAVMRTPGTGKTVVDLEIERRTGGHDSQTHNHHGYPNGNDHEGAMDDNMSYGSEATSPNPVNRLVTDAKNFAEMFVFSYGVVVFWNFTENQERDVLADLTFAENKTGAALLNRPLDQDDYETEEFHFEYNPEARQPRIFNDMITLLPRFDHMIKLTISHAIAQSTKLCFFEERMSQTMLNAQHVPKDLAQTGILKMGRTEIVRILGQLFKSRVDINLSSVVLDVPNFFWDAEPTLHPLYAATREYLEIDHRTKVLNERCRVFLDLAEVLASSVSDSKMSHITWIIIILIAISIAVTREGGGGGGGDRPEARPLALLENDTLSTDLTRSLPHLAVVGPDGTPPASDRAAVEAEMGRLLGGMTVEELRRWTAILSDEQMEGICGGSAFRSELKRL
ncbi:unnamed protein product [Parascedosporium putredinis]|uniref:DUF155 domain-containing protein n=1 Tax=Parascedosporium putredinis TaxID=1442378 RepID=A0A9P1HB25_9PEZI|nr:unnamed protein product [Parascedosporium putredinis]CAI8003452.1 unnamed protein product [Parascedosporium putredinis]